MRQYTVTEYEKEDYEKLEHMSIKDIVECLEHIKRGYLSPRSFAQDGTEEDYDNERLHQALDQAIHQLLKGKE